MSLVGSGSEARVLASLEGKPRGMHTRAIARATGLGFQTVASIIGRLSDRKRVIPIGTAAAAGVSDCAPNVKMWALQGTPMLPRTRGRLEHRASGKGSGQFAGAITVGKGFRWWSGAI